MDNKGKLFEKDFKASAMRYPEISVDRVYDNVGGYAGIKNICDFMIFKKPHMFYIENKSYKGSRISFDAISDYQYNGLLKKSAIEGVHAGVVLNFHEHDEAYYLDIRTIKSFIDEGEKSITLEDARFHGVLLPIEKKNRVTRVYDIAKFLEGIEDKF